MLVLLDHLVVASADQVLCVRDVHLRSEELGLRRQLHVREARDPDLLLGGQHEDDGISYGLLIWARGGRQNKH